MSASFFRSHSLGFSLIEVMLAIGLSLFLVGFLLAMYLANINSLKSQNYLNQIEQQARRAMQILQDEIKQAGLTNCQRLTKNTIVQPYESHALTIDNKLIGTDVTITIRHASSSSLILKEVSREKKSFTTSKELHFKEQEFLIISDCQKSEIVKVVKSLFNQSGQIIILAQPLHHQFKKNAQVSRFEVNKFYVAKTNRQDANKHEIYSLFFEDIKGRKTELVEGVTEMQLTYASEQSHEELKSAFIQDWSKIKGIFIRLKIHAGSLDKNWYTAIVL